MSFSIFAIDPGTEESGFVHYKSGKILNYFMSKNEWLACHLKYWKDKEDTLLAIEKIVSYGRVLGQTTIDTAFWVGRFVEAWNSHRYTLIERRKVAMCLCGRGSGVSDSRIRQALIDRF